MEAGITEQYDDIQQAKIQYEQANTEWQEMIKTGIEQREKELLDKYSLTLEGDDEKIIKYRNKVVKKLQKAENRR